jgi:hypothetical protein
LRQRLEQPLAKFGFVEVRDEFPAVDRYRFQNGFVGLCRSFGFHSLMSRKNVVRMAHAQGFTTQANH